MYKASTRDKTHNTKKKASVKHYSFSLTSSRSNVKPSQTAKVQNAWENYDNKERPCGASSHVGPQNCIPLFSSSSSKYLPILLLEAIEVNLMSLELGSWCT